MHSQNVATFDLPLMLTAAEAKGIALRQLHSAWLERTGYEWRLPWTHVDLEPADVVQVALDDGTLLNVRILETELGGNLELAWKTVLEESSSYTVTAVPGGGLNYLPQVDPVSSEARLFLLDVPLIRDSDDAGRAATGHYWAAAAYFDPPWRGAVLFASDDGAVYVAADETLDAVAWGVARTALPDTDLPFQTDFISQLQVTMVSGSLASVSNLEMLNGANLAALIRADGNAELIQFQDIALSEGVYTLTTLLRGRRGTEVFTGGHAVGDLFVLLDGDGVTRRPLALDRLGDTLHYRAVGRGGELRDARTAQLTLAGNDLKPYAPVQLEATGSWGADITLSWARRTRVGGELIDGTGEVPLAEDAELYELEILLGDLIVRTETGLTSGSYVYTSAAQATDFPGYIDLQRLVNPSFEEGGLSGWTVESGGTFVANTAHESLSGGHGDAWFLRSSGDGTLAQTVDVSALAQQIDLGLASARARCWVAETASDDDTANIRLQFLDENDVEVDTVDPVATDPAGTTFVQIEAEGAIPVGTRKIKVRLTFDQVSGVSPNVAMDDVTLEVDPGALGFLDIAVYQVSAQVGRGFRAAATAEV
jgi:hypothetical protein